MDVALVVGAGHVECMIQHDDDDVGELYFQGFVYAILFWVLCIPTTATSKQATNQPTNQSFEICMFTAQGWRTVW